MWLLKIPITGPQNFADQFSNFKTTHMQFFYIPIDSFLFDKTALEKIPPVFI